MTSSDPRGARVHHAAPAVLLALLLLVLTVLAPVTSRATPSEVGADVTPTDGQVTVTVDTLSPGVLSAGGTLALTATVANGTDRTLEAPVVDLGVQRGAAVTRSALDAWATADASTLPGNRAARETLDPLAPGATAEVSFSVTAAELSLGSASDWGPRGLAVRVSDGGERLAVQRTFVVWAPSDEVPPVRLSVVAAVTGPAVDPDPETYDDALSAAVGTDGEPGRLSRLTAATGATPEIGWVVDPALVAAAQASPDPAVTAWAGDVLSATEGRTTFALRAYDPDVAAYAHASVALPEGTPLPGADTAPAVLEDPSATADWRTDLAWPAETVPDLPTVTLAAASGATTVVVGGDALAPDSALTYTPTGTARVPTPAGDVTALVPDPVLTGLLAAGSSADPVTTQRLLAETAVIARERPAEARNVLVALPRAWDPDPAAFTARLAALQAAAWVDVVPVDDLLAAQVPDVARTALPESSRGTDEMPATELRTLVRSRDDLSAFATVAPDPAALTRPLETGFVTPTSVAFRSVPAARSDAVRQAEQASRSVTGSISIVRGSSILLLAEQQSLPVRLQNDLAQDAVVQVVLRPDEPRLKAPDRKEATIPAGSEVTVQVPVEAAGSVNVVVDVEVVSAARPDVRVAEPQQFVVRVRADWESVGTVVVAVLLAVGMIAGIWRTVRRGRSPRRLAGATVDQPAPPPDDSSTDGGPRP
ncbi:DUF6049 family protein [Cellulosimicrobium sp. PMB13]|uniref:DUF6049 family protein n=1 Tax=Cellulosimicrobium sp. PMB13 TaxID=3120158 RepID=UPI003F4BB66B